MKPTRPVPLRTRDSGSQGDLSSSAEKRSPLPGDVLLLSGKGKARFINRVAQMAMRRQAAKYTHVAIVVDHTFIVDAMPRIGVRFRRWADIADKFNIDECRVARHPNLEHNAETRRKIFQHARYYLKQRYALWALVRVRERFKHDSGLVCSQFVSMVLEKFKIKSSSRPPDKTLPTDIDACTLVAPWTRILMTEYGLCSRTGRARAPETETAGLLDSAQASAETLSAFRVREAEFLHGIGIISKQFAIVVSAMVSSRKREGGARRCTSGRTLTELKATDASATTGTELLKTWRKIYLDAREPTMRFAYQEGAPSALELSRENFHESLVVLLSEMKQLNASFARHEELIALLSRSIAEQAVTKASITEAKECLVFTFEGSSVLGLEPEETLQQRVDSVPALHEELRSSTAAAAIGVFEQAIDALDVLIEIDRERLKWIQGPMQRLPPAIEMVAAAIQVIESNEQQ